MFIRFDRIHERDRQTDGRADRQTPHDGTGRACIAPRDKIPPHVLQIQLCLGLKFSTFRSTNHI